MTTRKERITLWEANDRRAKIEQMSGPEDAPSAMAGRNDLYRDVLIEIASCRPDAECSVRLARAALGLR